MKRRVPVGATLVVIAALAIMVSLGVWQLQRKQWKEGLLAQFAAAQASKAEYPWPAFPPDFQAALYHRSRVDCAKVTGFDAIAGRSASDEPGWAHIAHCQLPQGDDADVALGWSNGPAEPKWSGGEVTGVIVSAGKGVRLVADPAQAGLVQLAKPDPAEMSGTTPMGHLSYAIQWFLFALIALVIYALALRKKWREQDG